MKGEPRAGLSKKVVQTALPQNGADSSGVKNVICKVPEAGAQLDAFEEQHKDSAELEG